MWNCIESFTVVKKYSADVLTLFQLSKPVASSRAPVVDFPHVNPHCCVDIGWCSSKWASRMSRICFSRSLPKIDSNDIGWYLPGSEWLSDLGIGEIHETFHSSGNSPSLMEMLNNSVTTGVILNAVSLSILAEMSSCPLAFVVSSVESRLYTSSSVQRKSVGQLSGEDHSALVRVGNSSPRKH